MCVCAYVRVCACACACAGTDANGYAQVCVQAGVYACVRICGCGSFWFAHFALVHLLGERGLNVYIYINTHIYTYKYI